MRVKSSAKKEPEEPFKSTGWFSVILEYDTDPIVFSLIIKGNDCWFEIAQK